MVAYNLRRKLAKDPLDTRIADIDVNERGAFGDVVAPAAAVRPQAVDDDDFVPGSKIRIGDMRPDEPGPAGDDDPHETPRGAPARR